MKPLPAIAQIALPTPAGNYFDYRITPEQARSLQPGCRVEVDFGRRRMIGIVIALGSQSACPPNRLKTVTKVIDQSPVIDTRMLQLMARAARYYHHPLGMVIFTGLPRMVREGKPVDPSPEIVWRATTTDDQRARLSQAPKQLAILQYLQRRDVGLSGAELGQHFNAPHSALRA